MDKRIGGPFGRKAADLQMKESGAEVTAKQKEVILERLDSGLDFHYSSLDYLGKLISAMELMSLMMLSK